MLLLVLELRRSALEGGSKSCRFLLCCGCLQHLQAPEKLA
jgi:hypothetical protein